MNKGYRCMVRLLDDQEEILECDFQGHQKGDYLMEEVCSKLNLIEKDFFGLRFVDETKQRHWLDLTKNILKQVKSMNPIIFCFRVKYYPKDPHRLAEELTRYHVYLQLRRDLLHGRLYCSADDAALLGAYIVQSELGDYDPSEHAGNYVSNFKILLKQTPETEQKIMELHQTAMQGQVPATAENNFLRKACMLDTYGIDPHPVKDNKGNQMYLGVNYAGVVTFQGSRKTHHFKWSEITKFNYEGKMFVIHLYYAETKRTMGFKCVNSAACRYLWRCAVEQRLFFTLHSSRDAPAIVTGGSFFSRGSKVRYSGRTEREMLEHASSVTRDPPRVRRSLSFRNRLNEGTPTVDEEDVNYRPQQMGPSRPYTNAPYGTNKVPSNTPYSNSMSNATEPGMQTNAIEKQQRPDLLHTPDGDVRKRLPSGEIRTRRHSDVTGTHSPGFDPAQTPEPGEIVRPPKSSYPPSGFGKSFSWNRFLKVCPWAMLFSVLFVLGSLLIVLEVDNETLRPLKESHEIEVLSRNYYLPLKAQLRKSFNLFE
ncbi:unnamed protein product [Cyprideis torosa]|uniref:Uncharacterized protein n=1 Tax=Cyprideis torosa TaxID=163714 RepID=A0A7R8WP76_9CRUS|nr:unnamed protein product [Cyprideis torosa]CAG0900991.1 unnamed protein product [Cyprideis torosa]